MTCWLLLSPLVLVKAWEYAFAVAFPETSSALSKTLTKAEAKAEEEALPDEVAIDAAWATALDAACTLGEDPVRFAVTQDAASASEKDDVDCSRARAGRA